MAEKLNILIAVPAYGGITVGTAHSVANLCATLARSGVEFFLIFPEINGIDAARNFIASSTVGLGRFTHCLMIDRDMVFRPQAILSIASAGKDVIGCAAPLRAGNNTKRLNVQGERGSNGIVSVEWIGAGILLLSVAALKKMIALAALRVEPNKTFSASGYSGPIYGFFDQIEREDGSRLPEDFSFCKRWKEKCGGQLFALLNEQIGHVDTVVHFTAAMNSAAPKLQDAQ